MSSKVHKLQDRIALKQENAWLRAAFKNAMAAFTEQQQNSANLARALWCIAQENEGKRTVADSTKAAMPAGATLRAYYDEDAGVTTFVAHVEEPVPAEVAEAAAEIEAKTQDEPLGLTATLPTPMGQLSLDV